jgi:hypothetical protein
LKQKGGGDKLAMLMTLTAFHRSQARLDRGLRPWFIAALAVCLGHWVGIMAFLVMRLGSLDFLYLHYTAEFGIDWIGNWYLIFTYPSVGLIFLLANVWVTLRLQITHRALTPLLAVATLIEELVIAAAGIIAVILNR